jgi:hypothetical protein
MRRIGESVQENGGSSSAMISGDITTTNSNLQFFGEHQ